MFLHKDLIIDSLLILEVRFYLKHFQGIQLYGSKQNDGLLIFLIIP